MKWLKRLLGLEKTEIEHIPLHKVLEMYERGELTYQEAVMKGMEPETSLEHIVNGCVQKRQKSSNK